MHRALSLPLLRDEHSCVDRMMPCVKKRELVEPHCAQLQERFIALTALDNGVGKLPRGWFGKRQSIDAYFRHVSHLGEGGFGTVFRAKPTLAAAMQLPGILANKVYAVKQVKLPKDDQDMELIDISFLKQSTSRHLEFVKALRNAGAEESYVLPTIAQILDAPDRMYFVMEELRGPDLETWFQLRRGRVPEATSAKLILQVVKALHHFHRNLGALHRDVKLENFGFVVPFDDDGDEPLVKLFDFGLAWVLREQVTEETAKTLIPLGVAGTPTYIAPETWNQKSGPASDVWGIGIMMHILLTGSFPFQIGYVWDLDENLQDIAKHVNTDSNLVFDGSIDGISEEGKLLMKQLLQGNVENRMTTAEALQGEWLSLEGSDKSREEVARTLKLRRTRRIGRTLRNSILVNAQVKMSSVSNTTLATSSPSNVALSTDDSDSSFLGGSFAQMKSNGK